MLPFFIARRHLASRKSHTVVNVISVVSVVAMAVPVVAMVVILSLHNGLSDFIRQMYGEFDPELRVIPRQGQLFTVPAERFGELKALPGVQAVSGTLEQNVLLVYNGTQWVATMRGVDSLYTDVVPVAGLVTHGDYELRRGDIQQTVLGQGIAYNLGVNIAMLRPIEVFALLPSGSEKPYTSARVMPAGIYALDERTDAHYLFTTIEFARSLTGAAPDRYSSLDIRTVPGSDPEQVRAAAARLFGPEFTVQTRYEQKATLYRMVQQEKWVIYLLLLLVVVISAFSLVGSLVMLVNDKAGDRAMLRAMGGSVAFVRRVFVWEGALITAVAIAAGIALGAGLALAQQHFGFIRMGGESFLMEAYPVALRGTDIALVAAGVLLLGVAVSAMTVVAIVRKKE